MNKVNPYPWLVGLVLAMACQSVTAQALYRMKDLGTLGGTWSNGTALNASGQAAGNSTPTCSPRPCGVTSHAFFWRNNGSPIQDIGSPAPGDYGAAVAINNSGQVVGMFFSSFNTHSFIWKNDGSTFKDLGTLGGSDAHVTDINDAGQVTGASGGADERDLAFIWRNNGTAMQSIGKLPGANSSHGAAINSFGQITGGSAFAGTGGNHAFVWMNDGSAMQDLGTFGGGNYTDGVAINDLGQVAGVALLPNGKQRAFLWKNDGTALVDLGDPLGFGSWPIAINGTGQVAGNFCTKACAFDHAFLWKNNGTAMVFLGHLSGHESQALGLNNSGQVTGRASLTGDRTYHAFLWRNDGTKIQDLNALIDPTDPLKPYVTLERGDAINDAGMILADGTDSRTGQTHAYLLQGTVLTLSPRSLAFGNQAIHTTSAAKSVTVTNTSAKAAAITSVTLTGGNANQFATTNNCGNSLAGHATCTVKVTFAPTTKGAKSATLNLNGGGGGLRTVALTGTGT